MGSSLIINSLRQGTLFQSHYPDCRQQNASEKTTSKPE
jgi:hypothetical protein